MGIQPVAEQHLRKALRRSIHANTLVHGCVDRNGTESIAAKVTSTRNFVAGDEGAKRDDGAPIHIRAVRVLS